MRRRAHRVAALVLTGCIAPIWLSGCTPGRTDHRFYNVQIVFQYAGREYHETWVHECDAFADNPSSTEHPRLWIRSRWLGFAKRLPDGSGVYFKPRQEICDGSEVGQILFGRPAVGDIWKYPYQPSEQARVDADESHDPGDYIDPTIYWLDSANAPTRIEACIFTECARGSRAKVKIVSITGNISQSQEASVPEKEMPVLAAIAKGPVRFVGYACWIVPADDLSSIGKSTPDRLLSWGTGGVTPELNSGYVRARSLIRELRARHLPLLNAWTLQGLYDVVMGKVDDRELANPDTAEEVRKPRRRWARACSRKGDLITFGGGPVSPDLPMVLSRLRLSAQSPTEFKLSTGKQLNSGGKFPHNLLELDAPNDPLELAAATSDEDRKLYIAEPHIFIP